MAAATALSSASRSPVALPVESRWRAAVPSLTRRPKARPGAAGLPLSSRDGAIGEILAEITLHEAKQGMDRFCGIRPGRAKPQGRVLRHLGTHDLDDALGVDPRPALGGRKFDRGGEHLG